MAELPILARLFRHDGEPVKGMEILVQSYSLSDQKWNTMATAVSDGSGLVKTAIEVDRTMTIGPIRLIEAGVTTRVIASDVTFMTQRRGIPPTADFGEISFIPNSEILGVRSDGKPTDIMSGSRRPHPDSGQGNSVELPGLTTAIDSRAEVELTALHKQNVEKTLMLQDREAQLTTKDHALTLASNERARLVAELNTARARAETAEAQLATVKTPSKGAAADIGTVFTTIGDKLNATRTVLKEEGNPFKIGRIKVNLKGDLGEGGQIFLGGDKETDAGVTIEMAPGDTGKTDDVSVTVPDVTGLTQTAARRVLRSVGLRLSALNQTVAADQGVHGQAIRQTPKATQSISHGSEVLVAFAVIPNA